MSQFDSDRFPRIQETPIRHMSDTFFGNRHQSSVRPAIASSGDVAGRYHIGRKHRSWRYENTYKNGRLHNSFLHGFIKAKL